jgi:hypothetical protein
METILSLGVRGFMWYIAAILLSPLIIYTLNRIKENEE